MSNQFALAAVWGACATWIFWWLFVPISGLLLRVSEPAVSSALRNGWSPDQVRPYLVAFTDFVPALLYGFVFGFPVGVLGTARLVILWLFFVVAFLVTMVARMLGAQYAVAAVFDNMLHRAYLQTALSTLVFVLIGARLRSAHVQPRAA